MEFTQFNIQKFKNHKKYSLNLDTLMKVKYFLPNTNDPAPSGRGRTGRHSVVLVSRI